VDRQNYAVTQERQRHDQALYSLGEQAIFALAWNVTDLIAPGTDLTDFAATAGKARRCTRCFAGAPGSPAALVSSVYKQAINAKCPVCFGTTLVAADTRVMDTTATLGASTVGLKALLVRPSIWDTNEEDYRASSRGQVIVQTTSVQSTGDFRMRTGDYLFRSDGSRFQMRTMSSNELRTGFATPTQSAVVGYNYGTCAREDESSVAYLIPPSAAVLLARLTLSHPHVPQGFADLEVINGPLIS